MKKFFILILTLILVLSLVSCGSDGKNATAGETAQTPGTSPTDPATGKPLDVVKNFFTDLMGGESFSYDFIMITESEDDSHKMTGSVAVEGENMSMQANVEEGGDVFPIRFMIVDGTMYLVDEANKLIMEMKVGEGMDSGFGEGLILDYEPKPKTGEGVGEINGRNLPYEEFTDEESGEKVRFYLDGNKVYGMESNEGDFTIQLVIENPQKNVPKDAFLLPEDYDRM